VGNLLSVVLLHEDGLGFTLSPPPFRLDFQKKIQGGKKLNFFNLNTV
jgi:hypothetical protein